jgi:hypothetical protein
LNEDYVQICEGESVELRAPQGASYLWNNGETEQNITVASAGSFQVTITDDSGCKTISQTVTVVQEVEINTNVEATNGLDLFPCKGDTLEFCVLNEFDRVTWNTGEQAQCLQVTSSGQYYARVENDCSSQQTDTFDIQFVEHPSPMVLSENYEENTGQLDLLSSEENTSWYRDAEGFELLGQGEELRLDQVFQDTTIYLQAEGLVSGDTLTGGKLDYTGSGGQNIPGFPGVLTFDVFKPFILKSVDVQCFEASTPILLIQNRAQETLLLQDVSLNEGINTLEIDFALEPGTNYSIRFVGDDPKCFRNTGNVDYPYPIGDGHGEVTSGGFTDDEYFYFYNWQLVPFEKECKSAIVAHTFEISSLQDRDLEKHLRYFPNPATEVLHLEFEAARFGEIKVLNRLGQVVISSTFEALSGRVSLDVSPLNEGLYYLQVIYEKGGTMAIRSFVRSE